MRRRELACTVEKKIVSSIVFKSALRQSPVDLMSQKQSSISGPVSGRMRRPTIQTGNSVFGTHSHGEDSERDLSDTSKSGAKI
jgi:hypothetical protein